MVSYIISPLAPSSIFSSGIIVTMTLLVLLDSGGCRSSSTVLSFNTIIAPLLLVLLVLLVIAITSEFGVRDPDGARELRADNCRDCGCDGDCICISNGGVGADDVGRLETMRFADETNDGASGNCKCAENCS